MSATRKSVEPGARAMAGRMVAAEESFLDMLMALGDIDRPAAERALACFRKHRAVKMDAVVGRLSVVDGRLLDRDVIRRAAGGAA